MRNSTQVKLILNAKTDKKNCRMLDFITTALMRIFSPHCNQTVLDPYCQQLSFIPPRHPQLHPPPHLAQAPIIRCKVIFGRWVCRWLSWRSANTQFRRRSLTSSIGFSASMPEKSRYPRDPETQPCFSKPSNTRVSYPAFEFLILLFIFWQ